MDIGTGSGILAIAAAKLGYQPVHAFDFDPESVRVARENARKNRVADQVKLTRGDVTKLPLQPARQYDLVCANLISNLLIAERRRIVNRLKPGGTLVLAGILAAEFAEVERAFADLKLKLAASRVENEWCSGAFCFGLKKFEQLDRGRGQIYVKISSRFWNQRWLASFTLTILDERKMI